MMKLIGNLALVELGDIFRADESERVRTLGGFVGSVEGDLVRGIG